MLSLCKHRSDMSKIFHGKKIDEDLASLLFFLDANASAQSLGELSLEQQKLGCQVATASTIRRDAASDLLRITDSELPREDL